MDKLLYLFIFLPIISGVVMYLFNRDWLYSGLYLIQIIMLALSGQYFLWTNQSRVIHEVIGGWDPIIGIALKIDRFDAILIMLSSILFPILLVYIHKNKENDYKFLFFFMMLQGSFNGYVLSDDLFNIFVMLELITIISTILIIYKKDGFSLKAGIYYLLFNSIGMLFFLVGIIIIYIQFGTLNLGLIKENLVNGNIPEGLRFAVILLISGLSVKSAVFPVYDWLPKAHSASLTSISAILSGLLVKTGIIGLMKITRAFPIYQYSPTFFAMGLITALLGVVFAFSQKDIKQILSFHTVSQIGLIMIGFSINIEVAMLYLINHSIIKTLLFLSTGVVINKYKERRVSKIDSLWINDRLLSVIILIGALALAGLPLTSGFISKATLGAQFETFDRILWLVLINAMTFASMLKILSILPGKQKMDVHTSFQKYASMTMLVGLIFFTGLFMTDIIQGSHTIFYYFKTKTVIKMSSEFLLGAMIYRKIAKNELHIMKSMRHFSIDFPDGIILLSFYVVILTLTFI